jgi:formylglycine-generating enzyme required for sulfatase activity
LVSRNETTFSDWFEYLNALPPEERTTRLPRVESGGFQGSLSVQFSADGVHSISFQPTSIPYAAKVGERVHYGDRTVRAFQDWLRFPVFGIAVDDALAYVSWLRASGRVPGARLCTDREWERAARGADEREYPHGDRLLPIDANFDATYGRKAGAMGPDEIGSHPASESPFGISDMAGNVWEWTVSSLKQGEFVARGGSYLFGANTARVTEREIAEPAFRDVSVGMRVCADAPL